MRFIGLVLLKSKKKSKKMLMKMIVLMWGEGGAAEDAANMASSGMRESSLRVTPLLRFQRSEGKTASNLQ